MKKIILIISLLSILILVGCNNNQDNIIKIATKPMTEQFILSEMLKALIEDQSNLNVEITKGIGGGTSNIHPALVKGDFDLYPEYTGTAWNYVLKETGTLNKDEALDILNGYYSTLYGLEWVGLYGFNNTYGLVVQKDIATEHNLKTFSDLAPLSPQLRFGAEYDFFEREDGYELLKKSYGMDFKETIDLDIGLKYQGIAQREIDAMNVFTTDGKLSSANVVLLEDDLNIYPNYYCGTVVRQETLKKHPELKDILLKMNNILNEKEMSALNDKIESQGLDETTVAREFLQSKGLLK